MASALKIELTRKRQRRTHGVLKANHLSTIVAVLNQANSVEEYKVLRDGLSLKQEITDTDVNEADISHSK